MSKNTKSNGRNSSVPAILNIIKYGNDKLPLIQKARTYGKSSIEYKRIKDSKLSTFRFNFNFKDSASNNNITSSNDLIYIDVDNIYRDDLIDKSIIDSDHYPLPAMLLCRGCLCPFPKE